ncbi:MAG: hypothetical protein WDW38_000954 [Sanguina aurantia]
MEPKPWPQAAGPASANGNPPPEAAPVAAQTPQTSASAKLPPSKQQPAKQLAPKQQPVKRPPPKQAARKPKQPAVALPQAAYSSNPAVALPQAASSSNPASQPKARDPSLTGVNDKRPSSQLNMEELGERQTRIEAMMGGRQGFMQFLGQHLAENPAMREQLMQNPAVAAGLAARAEARAEKDDERMAMLRALVPGEGSGDGEEDGGYQRQQDKVSTLIAKLREEDGTDCEHGESEEEEESDS